MTGQEKLVTAKSQHILDFCLAQEAEQRISCQALYYWTTLEKNGKMPSPDKVNLADLADIRRNLFLLSTSNGGGIFIIKECGDLLTETCGQNPCGQNLLDAFPQPLNESAVECGYSVVASKQPMLNYGNITLENDDEIKYRMIMTPLSYNNNSVDLLFGALSFRLAV